MPTRAFEYSDFQSSLRSVMALEGWAALGILLVRSSAEIFAGVDPGFAGILLAVLGAAAAFVATAGLLALRYCSRRFAVLGPEVLELSSLLGRRRVNKAVEAARATGSPSTR